MVPGAVGSGTFVKSNPLPSSRTVMLTSPNSAAISSFVDSLILLLTQCRCIAGNEGEVETAMREALNNAVVHGNHEDVRKCVSVTCLCEIGDVSMTVRDEGRGFDFTNVPDPTAPGTIYSTPRTRHLSDEGIHGRSAF